MMRRVRGLATALSALVCFSVSGAGAQTDLSGAWANQEDVCPKVFVKRGNRVVFAKDADFFGSGFIVDANRIRGKVASCTIRSRKQDGAVIHLVTTCSTDVALQNVQFTLKIEDANRIIRTFPGIPELDQPYFRCSL